MSDDIDPDHDACVHHVDDLAATAAAAGAFTPAGPEIGLGALITHFAGPVLCSDALGPPTSLPDAKNGYDTETGTPPTFELVPDTPAEGDFGFSYAAAAVPDDGEGFSFSSADADGGGD